ncbi:MAG: MEMO1 family protein [Candidatus Saganbacteria bacterium]|nr:MEMO1 family protein [Candidatus Saganbacteria bacterium]
MNYVKYGAILPHPPILIPFIGRETIKLAKASQDALKAVAKKLKSLEKELDLIVIITPHGAVSNAAVPVYASPVFEGNFSAFGVPKPNFGFKGCPEFAIELVKEAGLAASRSPETILDHGVLVPLYYPYEEKISLPILPIAIGFLSLKELYEFGKMIQLVAKKLGKRIAVIGSADMSHCLTRGAPSGYNPRGAEFDKKLVDCIRQYNIDEILNFPNDLAQAAGQDALWSIAILLGALDGLKCKHEVLSYEGPFGVGYMVATFQVMTNVK